MKLRARLIVAFLVLAVVPLAGIVTYSYVTSIRAFRVAVEAEARTQAEQLSGRMASMREDLTRRLDLAGELPSIEKAAQVRVEQGVLQELAARVATTAPLVRSLEFIPSAAAGTSDGARDSHGSNAPGPSNEPVVVYVPHAPPRPPRGDAAGREPRIATRAPSPEDIEAMTKRATEQLAKTQAVALQQQNLALAKALEEAKRQVAKANEAVVIRRAQLDRTQEEELKRWRAETEDLLGSSLSCQVRSGETVVGQLYAQVRPEEVFGTVLANARRAEGEIPFAVGADGRIHTASAGDEATLASLGVGEGHATTAAGKDWIVLRADDPVSRTSFGIARPLGKGLEEIRRTAVRNLAAGLALIGLAVLGILPISGRMTRNLRTLTRAAGELAGGDLGVRVPVRSRDEFGHLATAFNRLAADLHSNQQRLLEQQVQQRLLEAENDRKSRELEEARRFQLSLLPAALPEHPEVEIAVAMHTATEVGGDYYDFRVGDGGALTVALGDATGHGASAGTMVTVVKSLFTAATDCEPHRFLEGAAEAIRRMGLGRMYMAMMLVRLCERRVAVSAAGMPPMLVLRKASGRVEEIALTGMPLGAFDAHYDSATVDLLPGDTVLLMSDGLAELLDADGEPFGYERARAELAAAGSGTPKEIVAALEAVAERWKGGAPPDDDVTLVVLRLRDE